MDILDWTKFAIFIRESEVAIIQTILDNYLQNPALLDDMHAALMIVRHAFIYPPSAETSSASSRPRKNGPVDLALRSMYFKRLGLMIRA